MKNVTKIVTRDALIEKIRVRTRRSHKTVAELSNLTSVSESVIYKIRNGGTSISDDKLRLLARGVGISVKTGTLIKLRPIRIREHHRLLPDLKIRKPRTDSYHILMVVIDACENHFRKNFREGNSLTIKEWTTISGIGKTTLYNISNFNRIYNISKETIQKLLHMCGWDWDGVICYQIMEE